MSLGYPRQRGDSNSEYATLRLMSCYLCDSVIAAEGSLAANYARTEGRYVGPKIRHRIHLEAERAAQPRETGRVIYPVRFERGCRRESDTVLDHVVFTRHRSGFIGSASKQRLKTSRTYPRMVRVFPKRVYRRSTMDAIYRSPSQQNKSSSTR